MANDRTIKRQISHVLIFVMLCAQLALARHATIHVLEDDHIGAAYRHTSGHGTPVDHPADNKGKTCQFCLFSKSFSYVFPVAGVDVPTPTPAAMFILPLLREIHTRHEARVFQARAPPSLPSRT